MPVNATTALHRPVDAPGPAVPPGVPLPEVFRRVCEAAADSLRVERAGVWLFVNEDKALRCVSLFERSKRRHSKGACLPLADFPAFLRAISAALLVPCEAARSDPRTAELRDPYLTPNGITSVLAAPLVRDGRVVGVVSHEHVGPPRQWVDADRAFALAAADLVVDRMKAAECGLRCADHAAFTPRPADPPARPDTTAHDLRNLLAEVMAHAELIGRAPGLPPGVAARLARITAAAERGVELVRAAFEPPAHAEPDTGEFEALPRPAATDETGEHEPLAAR